MTEQWKELKETIIEMRNNDGIGTQQEVCKFLANLMDVLEKQMQKPKTVPIRNDEQVCEEYDIAIEQLKDLKYGFIEKPKTDDALDKIRNEISMLISFNRKNVIKIIDKYRKIRDNMTKEEDLINYLKGYIDSGKWKYEGCYLSQEDLEIIVKALKQKPKIDED